MADSAPCRTPGAESRADPAPVYGRPVDLMPEPGDLITAFSPQPVPCFRLIYSHQLQADHCRGEPRAPQSPAI